MSLSARVLTGVFTLSFFLCLVMAAGGYFVLTRVETALLSSNSKNITSAANSLLVRHKKPLVDLSRTIGRNKSVGAAVNDRDAEALREALIPTFNRASGVGAISDLILFDADLRPIKVFSLFEDIDPANFLAPTIVTETRDGKRATFDISGITDRRFGSALAFPIRQGRKVVGFGFIGRDIALALDEISELIGGAAILTDVNADGELSLRDYAGIETQFEALVNETETEDATVKPTPEDLAMRADQIARSALDLNKKLLGRIITLDSFSYFVAQSPVGETPSGGVLELFLATDFTEEHKAWIKAIEFAAATLAASLAIGLSIMFVFMRLQMRPVKDMALSLVRVSKGKSPVSSKSRFPAREVSELKSALETFLQQSRREADKKAAVAERLATEKATAERRHKKERESIEEIALVVDACASGNFKQRLKTDDKDGVLAELCEKVNQIGRAADEGLSAVQVALTHLESGDLTHQMTGEFKGVFGDISLSMNASLDALTATMRDVAGAAEFVRDCARDLSDQATELDELTVESSRHVDETSDAIHSIANVIQGADDAAAEAKLKINSISDLASDCETLSSDAVHAMSQIQSSSDAIKEIVVVIESIAFQTNLLALNASVEAARAGEAGRGFSVVASEVRALSERTSTSASEISKMVEIASNNVEVGANLVQDTGASFQKISSDMQQAVTLIDVIADAAHDATNGVDSIRKSASALQTSMKSNAHTTARTNSGVTSLTGEAEKLFRAIDVFTIDAASNRSDLASKENDADRAA